MAEPPLTNGRSATRPDAIEFPSATPPRKTDEPGEADQLLYEPGYQGRSLANQRPVRRFQFLSPATESPGPKCSVSRPWMRCEGGFVGQWPRKGQSNTRSLRPALPSNDWLWSLRRLSMMSFNKKCKSFFSVSLPSIRFYGLRRIFSNRAPQLRLRVKTSDELCECQDVRWIAKDETIETFRDDLRAAVSDAGGHRKTTGHGFDRRQSKGIVERGSGVEVSGSVDLHDVGGRFEEEHATG